MGKSEDYELEAILSDVIIHGFGTIHLRKLYRLLGRGNRSAITWRQLLDRWEEAGGNRGDLRIAELPHEVILLTTASTQSVESWAGE